MQLALSAHAAHNNKASPQSIENGLDMPVDSAVDFFPPAIKNRFS